MKINDQRHTNKELQWKNLEHGQVYVSNRQGKYMIYCQEDCLICLESGEWFDEDELRGDVFTHVNARLEIA